MTSQTVLLHLLKSILISGLFISYYWIALRDKKFHYYNRFYLLSASIISLVAPLLNFNWFSLEESVFYGYDEMTQFVLTASNASKSIQLGWAAYSLAIASIISIALLSLLLLHVIRIQLLKRRWKVTQMEGFDFINTNEDNAPFSFLNNLFWKQSISLQDEGGQQIFKHEITHIKQKHTWDRIYCQIVASLFWMNPFHWIIQKELVAIHEFIADEAAVGNSNVEVFAKMLLQTHYGNHFLNPVHSFFYSSIKRRLVMLSKSTNIKYSYLRRVMVLPVLIASVCLVSIKVHATEKIEKKVVEIRDNIVSLLSDTTEPANKKSVKFSPLAKPAYYINGVKVAKGAPPPPPLTNPVYYLDGVKITKEEMNTISTDNIKSINVLKGKQAIKKYPGDGQNEVILITTIKGNNLPPTVYLNGVKITEQEMNTISPNDIDSVNVLNGEEAIKKYSVIASFQEFGRVVLITTKKNNLKLLPPIAPLVSSNEASSIDLPVTSPAVKPVYYLDGVRISENEMNSISPNDIESINVLKGDQAKKKYPGDGKNGVVVITTKKPKVNFQN